MEEVISTNRETVCRYANRLVSTTYARTSAEREARPGGIPNPHPSSVNPLQEGLSEYESAANDDFDGVVNCVQWHEFRAEGYCRRKVSTGEAVSAAFKCRFG